MSTAEPEPGATLTAAERLGYALATHPRTRRVLLLGATTHALTLWALAAAPRATAATMAAALNWTGITDTDGVPIGAYFLSTVDTMEALADAGPDVSVTDPGSWIHWGAHAVTTGLTHDTVASWVQAQASCYVFLLSTVLWLLRFAMSSTWMSWLASWFRPLLDALRQLLADLHVFPICLALGIGAGAFHILWHGRRGHGAAIILSAFAIGVLGLWLTRDPLGDLTGDDGLLFQARTLAFSVAQAATHNGPIAAGGATGELGHLTGVLADALVRAPLQIWNFGTTVDGIGTCGHAWSAAITSGVREEPAHAMAACGAPQALRYAQGIDGSVLALGLGFCVLALFFAVFVLYVTYSYVTVCGAALLNAVLAIFAVGPAMIHGTPRRRARRRLEQFLRHAFLVFVYVLYACIAALLVLETVAPGGLAAQVGMTSPVAMLVLVALWSAVATGVLRYLKHDVLHDHTREDLARFVDRTVRQGQRGYRHGRDHVTQGKDLADKTRHRFSRSNDDDPDPGAALTQPPVPGRLPGGPAAHPTRNAGPRPPTPPPTPASRAGAAAGAAGVPEAGATMLAPEVAIPAAAAVDALHAVEARRRAPTANSTPAPRPSGPERRRDAPAEPPRRNPGGSKPATENQRPQAPPPDDPRPARGRNRP